MIASAALLLAVATTSASGAVVYGPEFFADARPDTAMDMVSRVPGFSFDGGDGSRGLAGAAGNVLIDGQRPAAKSESLSSLLARIPAASVARVELVRAGGGLEMAGHVAVLNVVRKAGPRASSKIDLGASARADGGRGAWLDITASRGDAARTLSGGASLSASESVSAGSVRRAGETTRTDGTGDHRSAAVNGAADLAVWSDGSLQLRASTSADSSTSTSRYVRPFATDTYDSAGESRSGELSAELAFEPAPRWRAKLTGLHRMDTSVSETRTAGPQPSAYGSETRTRESILGASAFWTPFALLSLQAGGETALNRLEGHSSLSLDGQPVALPGSDVTVEERRGEIFAQAAWTPTPALSAELGGRFEASTLTVSGQAGHERSLAFLKPRLSLGYTMDPQTVLHVRLEHEVGQLNFWDFVSSASLSNGTVDAGNAELLPQQAWVIEAGVDRRFWGSGAFELTARRQYIADAPDRVLVGGYDAPGNIGEARRDALEGRLLLPLPALGVPGGALDLGGDLSRSTVTDPVLGNLRPLSGDTGSSWRAAFRQDLPDLGLSWGFQASNQAPRTWFRAQSIDRYTYETALSAFVEYKPSGGVSLRLDYVDGSTSRTERALWTTPRTGTPATETRTQEYAPYLGLRLRLTS